MRLCKRPTHWLPQNPLAFIINKLLLIIRALLRTMHVLYMKGRGESRDRQAAAAAAGRERDEKMRQ